MAKLHFYYSAMNAGKTTTLLQSSYNYRERGMRTLLFTPLIDNRFKVGSITSRIGLASDAHPFEASFNFFDYIDQHNRQDKVSCVLVDEAQFLSKKQVQELADVATQLNIPVLAYGLRSDFLGEPFEGSQYLLAWAQELNEIKTICWCGRKATMNARIDGNGHMVQKGEQIEIGGNDRYIALCYKHYRLGLVKP
ncbi:MAG: thymidine kinase [Alphaproteobacteria bacterium]